MGIYKWTSKKGNLTTSTDLFKECASTFSKIWKKIVLLRKWVSSGFRYHQPQKHVKPTTESTMGPHGTVAMQPETRRSGPTEVKAIPILPAKLSVNHFWQDNEPHLKQRNTLLLSTVTIQSSHTEWQQLYFHHRTRNKVAWRIISQVCKPYGYLKCSIFPESQKDHDITCWLVMEVCQTHLNNKLSMRPGEYMYLHGFTTSLPIIGVVWSNMRKQELSPFAVPAVVEGRNSTMKRAKCKSSWEIFGQGITNKQWDW